MKNALERDFGSQIEWNQYANVSEVHQFKSTSKLAIPTK